jgi:transcriptional regulator
MLSDAMSLSAGILAHTPGVFNQMNSAMYIPPAFRETRADILHRLIREHSFATLISQLDGQLFASHLPILLDPSRAPHGALIAHMARANPHWRGFSAEAAESLVIFQGPHAYISPSWYVAEQAVPTWNYEVVHAYGRPRVIEDEQRIRALLDETVGTFEAGLPHPWSTQRVTDEYIAKMAQGIVAFEMPISRLEGKRKLGQNRPADDIRSAAAGLQANGDALGHVIASDMLEAAAAKAER